MAASYDRYAEDLGNIVGLEHVNLQIPDQQKGTLFYISGLGLTRDPFMNTGLANMWINVGKSQFHLPTGEPWVLRGAIGLVTPDRDALLKRLDGVEKQLEAPALRSKRPTIACGDLPVGQQVQHAQPRRGPLRRDQPRHALSRIRGADGTAKGIAKFYRKVFDAQTAVEGNGSGKTARIAVGDHQCLRFREISGPVAPYDGHHIQVYVQDFGQPHHKLAKHKLLTEESNAYQYRFEHIVDLDTDETLFEIEHEIRSLTHPLYARPLINRNPMQSQQSYEMGGDEWNWSTRRSNVRLPGLAPITTPRAQALADRRATRAGGGM